MRCERGGVTLGEISSPGLGLMDECGSTNCGNARERSGWRGRDYVGLGRVESGFESTYSPVRSDVRRIGEMINKNMSQCTEGVMDGWTGMFSRGVLGTAE